MGIPFSTLTAEFVDGALVIYDSAHTAVVTLNSSGLNWVGGVTISSAVLVASPTLSTAAISTSALTGVTTISSASITGNTVISSGGICNVTISTATITTSQLNACTLSTANLSTSVLAACSCSTGTITTSALSVCTISNSAISVATISTASLKGNTVVSTSLSIDAGIVSYVGQKTKTLVGSATLTISSGGTLISVTASDAVVTLPGVASSGAIVQYTIVNACATATAQIVVKTTTTELIKGAFTTSTGADIAANTGATHNYGDWISVINNPGSTSWGVVGLVGIWASTT